MAVSTWKVGDSGDHVVRLFEGSGAMWTAVCVVAGGFAGPGCADGQLHQPCDLRFSGDGTGLVVADAANGRVSLLRVEDGSFVRHVATELSYPMDVEGCEGGWLVACWQSHSIEFVEDGGGRGTLCGLGSGDGHLRLPATVALVPGLGLVVREFGGGGAIQLFATPDAIAMASMSPHRVAWMVVVARGIALLAV